ncbi:heat-shock protein HtpX [Brevibacterium sp. HMSC063G07]|nr:heat-shock protein HtpX [Brevibacterium sp. HMSC063G07]OFS25310.1 heat-shock protein HtpX [Brevibacterium sp. HMSC07C04]
MAAGWLRALSPNFEVRSAGSAPAAEINPAAVEAMREVGIDIAGQQPKRLSENDVAESDVVITMGCGDTCPIFPGKRYEDWQVDDPAGQSLEFVRAVRDDIRQRVEALIAEFT